MSGSLQNKLHEFEAAPPSLVWDKIAAQLDSDFVIGDLDISQKLENTSILPPADIWDKINQELNGESIPVPQSKVIPLIYKRIAAAALIAGVLITVGLYFIPGNNNGNPIVQTVPAKNETIPVTKQTPPVARENSPVIAERIQPSVAVKKIENRIARKDHIIPAVTTENNGDYIPDPEQAPLYELSTVSALQPVSVSAPPLRDNKGHIILDASLIGNPDAEYIVVTGPNGKQTKISSKFLSCLTYINASLTSGDTDSKSLRCKAQFDEWRNRVLDQPAFIPTANNFFDIFELKDMIQDM